MNKNHYRWSEESFRRYEAIIAQYIAGYPNQLLVNPAPLSLETVRCRLPDAVKSFLTYGWASELLKSPEDLKTIWEQSSITVVDGFICIRSKNSPSAGQTFNTQAVLQGAPRQATKSTSTQVIVIDHPTVETMRTLLFLCDKSIFQVPLHLVNIPPDVVTFIHTQQEFFNIGYAFQEDKSCVVT